MTTEVDRVRTTRGKLLGQLMFCDGCCCGRTDRGCPEFPKDRIKSVWNARKLNRHVQLTISGCLGPCDVANVACIVRADGTMAWLGELTSPAQYESLINWALNCQRAERLLPLPDRLRAHEFERFSGSAATCRSS